MMCASSQSIEVDLARMHESLGCRMRVIAAPERGTSPQPVKCLRSPAQQAW